MAEMYPRVESWIDWIAMEHEMLKLWAAEGVFSRLR